MRLLEPCRLAWAGRRPGALQSLLEVQPKERPVPQRVSTEAQLAEVLRAWLKGPH